MFKSMNDKKNSNGNLLDDNSMLTNNGQVICELSLDDLPQLINIVKGDMSLIGPRPLMAEYLNLYNNNQARRHEITAGIS